MKFFKSELLELYKTYFENMKVKDFEKLEDLPGEVSISEMQNLASFINKTKEDNSGRDISEMKIGDLVFNYFIVNNTNLSDNVVE